MLWSSEFLKLGFIRLKLKAVFKSGSTTIKPEANTEITKGINAAQVVYINFEFSKCIFPHEILKVFQRFIMNRKSFYFCFIK